MLDRTHTFVTAIAYLRQGDYRIRRTSWSYGTFVVMMPALHLPPFNTQDTARKVNDRTAKWIGEDKALDCQPYFAHHNGDNNHWTPGYAFTSEDVLADDWMIDGEDPMKRTVPYTFSLRETDRDRDVAARETIFVYDVTVSMRFVASINIPDADMPSGPAAEERIQVIAREYIAKDVDSLLLDSASYGMLLSKHIPQVPAKVEHEEPQP